MVFPLVMAAGFVGPQTMGEDVATMVGNALDGAGPLRWTDGWPLLSPRERDDIRGLSLEKAKSLARSKRCAYYLMGRLVARGDSIQVFLELDDVQGDTVVARGKAAGPADLAWSLGLRAINDVLPALIPTGAPDITAEWKDRDPGAIANFLLGEAAFRRVHLVEALGHYRDAVKTDSLFGLAAVRGAQAATWNHRPTEAAALIQIAIRRKMPPQYLHFALGYQDYLEGQADAAAAEFHRALDVDPDMAAAWMQLGEVYTHLLPEAGDLQSQAEAAFEEAHRLDPKATNILLHLIEIRLRKGEVAKAQPIVRQFLDASPPADLARQIALMATCAQGGPADIDWVRESQENTLAVLLVGHKLAAGGARLDCALPAFAAAVKSDTSAAGDLRWFALLGLQAALLAQGRSVEAIKAVDSRPAQDGAMAMYLLDAPVFPAVMDKAFQVAQSYKRECGAGYSKCANPYRVWQLGIWDALRGHTVEAELAARELVARAGRDTTLSNRHFLELFARSVRAHAALARSDTSTALLLLDASLRDPVPGGENIEWDIAKPRGLDRLRLAQLLLAVGQPQRALDVAQVFDSASPSVYLIYLVESLKVRVDAAGAVGNAMLAAQYRARLSKFRQGRNSHLTEGQEGVT
jgi:tetratricopeptide (TPR) repeat protein